MAREPIRQEPRDRPPGPGPGSGAGATPGTNPVTGGTTGGTGRDYPDKAAQLGIPEWAWNINNSYLWYFDDSLGYWVDPRNQAYYNQQGQPVNRGMQGEPPFPGLVWDKNTMSWRDPATGRYYDVWGKQIKGDPRSRTGPVEPRTAGNDGPINYPLPGNTGSPGAGTRPPFVQLGPPGPPNYVGNPGAPGSGGAGQLANPMPQMPQIGTHGTAGYQQWSRANPTSGGSGPAFRPWGQNMGYLSQILRYGGTPQQLLAAGAPAEAQQLAEAQMMMAAQAAALSGQV